MVRQDTQTTEEVEETPAYMQYADPEHPNHHIFLAQEARRKKATVREAMTPREQELLWAKEKFTELSELTLLGKRRTLLGLVQNAKHISAAEKNKLCDKIVAMAEQLRANIPVETDDTEEGASASRQLQDPFA